MHDLVKNHLDQLMQALLDFCESEASQPAAALSSRITDIKADLGNLDEPRPDEGG